MADNKSSTLIHGSNIISRKLKCCLSPMGWFYNFDHGRPKPLPLLIVLANCAAPIALVALELMMNTYIRQQDSVQEHFRAIGLSTFITRLAQIIKYYRYTSYISTLLIILSQHSSMASVIASSNNFVSEKEQAHFARLSFALFLLKSVASCVSILAVAARLIKPELGLHDLLVVTLVSLSFCVSINLSANLMFTCYLGSALGKHVENFSRIYVDTMFDQFMKAIEKEEELASGFSSGGPPARLSPFEASSSGAGAEHSQASAGEQNQSSGRKQASGKACCASLCPRPVRALWHLLVAAFARACDLLGRLNERKYPELPEMKMTKLSSTSSIQISESMRMANSHLIRVRLRRTQVMLSELRDLVSDINKTSSPIVLMFLAYETMLIILITTSSIQAKVYKSIDVLIIPTVSGTISLAASVVYICTCLDETAKQLKLLINKLFDFIIMNHRVQSSDKSRRGASSSQPQQQPPELTPDSDVCIVPGREAGAINETWSQFQYTRKLANTIQFTMGGIFPVSRRMVLSILGHILSAVFISIEIMSIIDTQNTPAAHNPHQSQAHNFNSSAKV